MLVLHLEVFLTTNTNQDTEINNIKSTLPSYLLTANFNTTMNNYLLTNDFYNTMYSYLLPSDLIPQFSSINATFGTVLQLMLHKIHE
jgi:hypothetical protein